MSNVLKASIHEIEITNNNMLFGSFEEILNDIASKLDDTDSKNTRVLDININDIETSIWFDSFDHITKFNQEEIFENAICFLLAKDMDFQLIEDKEEKSIKNLTSTIKQKPKIPAHCVYLKNENILLMEETTHSPKISTLKRGITSSTIRKNEINFKSKYRKDIIERLHSFVDKIKSIELIDIHLEKYLNQTEDTDGYLYNFLSNPETRLTAKLQIESTDWRTKVVNFFMETLNNTATKELENIKIGYKDEKNNSETIALFNNLIYLQIEKEIYHEDISNLKNLDRIEYSKNIYKIMIEAYYEENESF